MRRCLGATAVLAGCATVLAAVAATARLETGPAAPAEPAAAAAPSSEPRSLPTRAARERPRRARAQDATPIEWRRSEAIGDHAAGRLRRGVLLPAGGRAWVSWDPILKRRPNREWRRWGTDRLVRTTLRVLRGFAADHPKAPRVAVGDLSRPHGGDFGPQFGSIGHASHQNGLDVDIYYPRTDRRVRPPKRPSQVDLRLAQDLVDRFVAAGAEKVFVGPSLDLRGPAGIVVPLANHDNHLHARLPL